MIKPKAETPFTLAAPSKGIGLLVGIGGTGTPVEGITPVPYWGGTMVEADAMSVIDGDGPTPLVSVVKGCCQTPFAHSLADAIEAMAANTRARTLNCIFAVGY
jgi:hypothetical protein